MWAQQGYLQIFNNNRYFVKGLKKVLKSCITQNEALFYDKIGQASCLVRGNRTMNTFKKMAVLSVLCAAFFVLSAKDANALRVSMKRIIFEGSSRSEILTIINNTNETQTYRLGWKKYKMSERNSLRAMKEGADDGGILWADKMLRFAPRRVTIPAGGSQQIRLLLRRPKDIQQAEYRSHLWIVTESKPEKFDIQAKHGEQMIKLAVQPGIALPIFVRHGELEGEANIADAKLSKVAGGLSVSFTLNRVGSTSVYGDFDFVCKDGSKNVVLKQVRGISVYTEINKRYLDFDIPLNEGQTCNNMGIEYRSDPEDRQHKGATLATASVSLQ